jgi:2-keto-3-deoxy-L-rhamnonate aldolase RhmA
MDKLLAAAKAKRLSLGILEVTASPEIVETLAYAGFDWVCIDLMFESTDWTLAAHMVRAAKGAGISPVIRVPSNPWLAGEDPHVLVDITRALGIDATGVIVSLDSPRTVVKAVEVCKEWHRNIHIMPFADDMRRYAEVAKKMAERTLLVPLLESEHALRHLEDFFKVDGLKAICIGISDASRMLGHPFDYEHPEVWKLIDKAANLADKYDLYLMGNTGYQFQDPESIAQRIRRLHDHGVRMVLIQSTGALLQFFCQSIIKATKAAVRRKGGKR